MNNIRNFAIIAHIDHGKSTLADRFIELCKNISRDKIKSQTLDTMDLEREKGITIKAQCLTLKYKLDEQEYTLNLIDTPGHIDFSYEVSRALAACDGVILLIDITQGIEAQTLSHYTNALNENLEIIVALNKIDIKNHNILQLKNEIENTLNIDQDTFIEISAKTGYGVKNLITSIIKNIPAPKGHNDNKLKALIIDSWFNTYVGITCIINIKDGIISKNDKIIVMSTNKIYKVHDLGIFVPEKKTKNFLKTGETGFIIIGSKELNEIRTGDTITLFSDPALSPLSGLKTIQPKIFATIYPSSSDQFEDLKIALSKLILNDSSLTYTLQQSNIFGFGFKCGFLGLLHMEITQERLEREYNLSIIITPPNVMYKLILKDNSEKYINTVSDIPQSNLIKELQEPIALVTILAPNTYTSDVITLCNEARGSQKKIDYKTTNVLINYEIPMSELIFNFFPKLQTISNGFASFDYVFLKYQKSDLTKVNILINDKKIDALEFILHKNDSYQKSKAIIHKMEKIIPQQLFEIKIQAAIEKKIIAKTTIKALKKNVLSKCYGGDISRKKKLLKKQKEGKKRLKKIGNVEIPQNAFLSIMNIEKK